METKGNQFILNVNKTDFVDSGTYTAVIDNGIEKIEVPVKMNVGGNLAVYLSFYTTTNTIFNICS